MDKNGCTDKKGMEGDKVERKLQRNGFYKKFNVPHPRFVTQLRFIVSGRSAGSGACG